MNTINQFYLTPSDASTLHSVFHIIIHQCSDYDVSEDNTVQVWWENFFAIKANRFESSINVKNDSLSTYRGTIIIPYLPNITTAEVLRLNLWKKMKAHAKALSDSSSMTFNSSFIEISPLFIRENETQYAPEKFLFCPFTYISDSTILSMNSGDPLLVIFRVNNHSNHSLSLSRQYYVPYFHRNIAPSVFIITIRIREKFFRLPCCSSRTTFEVILNYLGTYFSISVHRFFDPTTGSSILPSENILEILPYIRYVGIEEKDIDNLKCENILSSRLAIEIPRCSIDNSKFSSILMLQLPKSTIRSFDYNLTKLQSE